jgi:hypothetical protein
MFWGLLPQKGFRKRYRVLRDLHTKSDVERLNDDRKPLELDASKLYGLNSL